MSESKEQEKVMQNTTSPEGVWFKKYNKIQQLIQHRYLT